MKEEITKNKFEETTGAKGFFKEYFKKFSSTVQQEEFSKFEALKNDEDRILFVSQRLPICSEMVQEENHGKNSEVAGQMKAKGNAEFVRGDTWKSLASYTQALLKTPKDSSEYAVILANRSAALYHLEQFDDALEDIDLALSKGYPKELRYKILERKAKCLLALQQHDQALLEFRKTLQALDDCKLPVEKKLKMQSAVQIMLNVLIKPTTRHGHINALVEKPRPPKKETPIPTVTGKRNATHPALSNLVTIKEDEGTGRYAAAAAEIAPGDTLNVEKAYCSVLLAEHAPTHCLHCLKRTRWPYPCGGCSTAVFCSSKCQQLAQASYHEWECPLATALYLSGSSVMVLMALRIITQRPLEYFLQIKPQLEASKDLDDKRSGIGPNIYRLHWSRYCDGTFCLWCDPLTLLLSSISLEKPRDSLQKYESDNYAPVYHLVRHEDQRQPLDFFERSVMAVFLLRVLKTVGYFGPNLKNLDGPLTGDEIYIGSLILRHLQLLQFNAHELSELEVDCTESVDKSESIFIGGALFPTLSLFNHSCDPAIVRYFIGTTVVVRAIRTLEAGQLVAENYGPIFTIKPREERKKKLKSEYWFDCACLPCQEDWPMLNKMDRSVMPFKCEPDGKRECHGIIQVPLNTEDFMPKCNTCGERTNILKGLKILQDTDAMYRQASMESDRGKLQKALDTYLEILKLLYRHLAPPFYDYHLCQQAIRKCMLSLGNKYTKEI